MKKKNYSVPSIGIINLSFEDVLTLSVGTDDLNGTYDLNGTDDHDALTNLFGNQS